MTVTFEDDGDNPIYTSATHLVTEATVTLTPDRGPPGTRAKVTGEGFRPFTPVTMVMIGGIDVTPSPAPHTDRYGMMEFEVLVPQSEPGLESILVLAGGIHVLADFQVGEPLVENGSRSPLLEELGEILGDNLLVAWHFGNDTKKWDLP